DLHNVIFTSSVRLSQTTGDVPLEKLTLAFDQSSPIKSPTPTAGSAWLQFPGIDGESTDPGFEGFIDAQNFALSPLVSSVTFTKFLDRTSPALNLAVARGTLFPSVEADVLTPQGLVRYHFNDVVISSVAANPSGGTRRSETLTFHYANYSAPMNGWLQIPGIQGESTDPGFEGAINIQSFALS